MKYAFFIFFVSFLQMEYVEANHLAWYQWVLQNAVDQALGVGILGVPDDFVGGALLHIAAVIHHQHLVTELLHHALANTHGRYPIALLSVVWIGDFSAHTL